MRIVALWCVACGLVACGKKTAPAPVDSSPPVVATVVPAVTASASIADAAADVADDAGDAEADEDAGAAAWVTASSRGCLGWNPTTRHAICITGTSGTDTTSTVVARDLFDGDTPTVDWLDPKFQGSISGYVVEPAPAASVAKVAKLVAKLHLEPIDKSTMRKLGIGQELTLNAPNNIKLRYKRSTGGALTTDTLELVCGTKTSTWPNGGSASWPTKDAPKESSVELYVDSTATMALVVWANLLEKGVSWVHFDFAGGIDLTSKDSCQY